MFINYNELRKFVSEIFMNYQDDNIEQIIKVIDKCNFIDIIIDLLNIDKESYKGLYKYNLYLDKYLGTVSSEFEFNLDNDTTRKNLLKYILMTNPNRIEDFMDSLLNINNLTFSNTGLDLKVKFVLISKSKNSIDINSSIKQVRGRINYFVFCDKKLIGLFDINSSYYKNIKQEDLERTIDIKEETEKQFILDKMKSYNKKYLDSLKIKNANKKKIKSKRINK